MGTKPRFQRVTYLLCGDFDVMMIDDKDIIFSCVNAMQGLNGTSLLLMVTMLCFKINGYVFGEH